MTRLCFVLAAILFAGCASAPASEPEVERASGLRGTDESGWEELNVEPFAEGRSPGVVPLEGASGAYSQLRLTVLYTGVRLTDVKIRFEKGEALTLAGPIHFDEGDHHVVDLLPGQTPREVSFEYGTVPGNGSYTRSGALAVWGRRGDR